ncbi:tetratricopeptide repeat protein [Streptomyces sp. CB02400]|uniref:tetratricopeptide repeat protein n=1 Tax=Streptomyces sp. CB02400 TaxID=1703944 RepID=UPI00093D0E1A|nr:hypothetical protein [Streptomyces sp. CB02400]OKK08897.1 hypothetical protein AMK33_18530 [Streptomyces sp. CB02400]
MFSRRNRRPTSPDLAKAWECLDTDDVPGALRRLRQAGTAPLDQVAPVVGRAARTAGFDDLQEAASALAAHPGKARALYDYGYACVERGVSYLAVPALREALRLAPDSPAVLRELVSAYEDEGRHRDAADALLAHEASLTDWPDRYLLVFNAVLAGDLELARRQHTLLPAPDDAVWLEAQGRQNRVLERATSAGEAGPLDHADLRGWQYVMGGTVLGTMSPYGYDAGMAGRYAWLQDTHGQCLLGLLRLRSVLAAADVRPRSVSLLPDRGSRILGLAAAEVLDLPAEPYEAGRQDTVVVAHDLGATADEREGPRILEQLLHRTPGQVLHEHACCWTDPPAVTADSVALLHQSAVAPWAAGLRQSSDGGVEPGEPDERPEAEIAAEIVGADPTPDEGDGSAPADPVERLTDFVSAVRGTWLRGDRYRLRSSGPVASSRFL